MSNATNKHVFTEQEIATGRRLLSEFPFYSKNILKIQTKVGKIEPFILKNGQKELDTLIEKQLQETGMSRVYLLKYRQGGFSTYFSGRDFWKTSTTPNTNTMIVGNKRETSANIFGMTKRFYDNAVPHLRPPLSNRSESKMTFDFGKDRHGLKQESVYRTGTAGDEEVGRSGTNQRLHCTEFAFWENPETVIAALFNTVADKPGTSIVLETTANGQGNFAHNFWLASLAGETGFLPVFIPWFVDEEYQSDIPAGFELTDEEQEYKAMYGLTDRQMAWKRQKESIQGKTLSEGKAKFKQEYPANADEAFRYSATDSFIPADAVIKAFERPGYRSYGAIVAGFDPSFTNSGDRKAFCYRQGANVWGLEYPVLDGHEAMVTYLKKKLDATMPYIDRLFMDTGGGGYNLYDTLRVDGYGDRITLVDSASGADDNMRYANKRAEMTDRLKQELIDDTMPLSIKVSEEHKNALLADLTAEGWDEPKNRLLIEKKESVKKRLGISPDGKDCIMLTYARKIIRKHVNFTIASHKNQRKFDNTNIYALQSRR